MSNIKIDYNRDRRGGFTIIGWYCGLSNKEKLEGKLETEHNRIHTLY